MILDQNQINTTIINVNVNYFLLITIVLFVFCLPLSLYLDYEAKSVTSYGFRIAKRFVSFALEITAFLLAYLGWYGEKNLSLLIASVFIAIVTNMFLFINLPKKEYMTSINKKED